MKRIMFLLLTFSISLSSQLWTATESANTKDAFQPFTGKVVGNKVRLRLAPNLEAHIIRELSKGDLLAVVQEDQEYYAVKPSKDFKAYIFRTHVLDNKVEGERVNIRLAPNLESPVVAQLNSGDTVNIDTKASKGKWFQIDLPQNVQFWISKDYIEKVGPLDYIEKYQERQNEASQLLATADLITQAEFRKPFQEIDIARIEKNYERLIHDFNDIDRINQQAKIALDLHKKDYNDRKISYLENKAGKAALEVKTLNAKLSTMQPKEDAIEVTPQPTQAPLSQTFNVNTVTDKMKIWQPLEYALFQSWTSGRDESITTLNDFYQDEAINSKTVDGIVEAFNAVVKNKPGDYVLVQNNMTSAYLYSTHINLTNYIGKHVKLKISERDNHQFAFPAYYVLDVKEE